MFASTKVLLKWNIGRRIQVQEQKGKKRADYGSFLLKNLSKVLEPEYGSGFSYRQLAFCRKFYTLYPIVNTVCSQLNWSQYKLLIAIDDADKREYYQLESVNNAWTKRELERQIHSQLYERLLISSSFCLSRTLSSIGKNAPWWNCPACFSCKKSQCRA